MRVLHLIDTLSPTSGGPSEFVRNLLEFAPPDVQNEVLCLDNPTEPFLAGVPAKVHALGRRGGTFGYRAELIPWLRGNRHRFTCVIVNGLWQYISVASRIALGSTPYFIFPHGMLDPYFRRESRARYLKKLGYWLAVERGVLKRAKAVLFTCQMELELARQTFPLNDWTPIVLPFGARHPPEDLGQAELFFAAHPALSGRSFLLFLGRIDPKKGCDMLVDAFARFAAENPGLDLVMAGPDRNDWRADLEAAYIPEAIRTRIHWPGLLQGDIKWGAFRASDAFILPSHQENFGIAVAEALACAKPVLISDKINIFKEIVESGAGLVEPDTLAGTASLIARWHALTSSDRQAMSFNAIRCFNRYFDAEASAAALYKLAASCKGS